jgi:hypothetical protein
MIITLFAVLAVVRMLVIHDALPSISIGRTDLDYQGEADLFCPIVESGTPCW